MEEWQATATRQLPLVGNQLPMDAVTEVGDEYVLGIDVGSSSVKATLVRRNDLVCCVERYLDCSDTYIINDGKHSEQNVALLVNYVNQCVNELPAALLRRVVAIGVCGQMHGVVCWSSKDRPWMATKDGDGLVVDENKVSHHYTWQDSRCTPSFLESLPSSRTHLSIHTGYGCATLFWLNIHSANTLQKFDRAATVADFIVAMLCNLDTPHMSPQNAASWGYYDAEYDRFDKDALCSANFPVHMLPHVQPDNGVAGMLRQMWHGIQPGVPVGVALGDLQAYVLATLQDGSEAIVNISTSAQMVFIEQNFVPSKAEKTNAKVVPYFEGKYLYEGAVINGGNAISLFVNFVSESTQLFGCNIPKEKIWRRLIADSVKVETDSAHLKPSSPLQFVPTFWGERRFPLQRATICHLTPNNLNLAALFHALCEGVIDNIHELVPVTVLHQRGIEKIVGTGTALLRNETLQLALKKRYAPLPVFINRSTSADSAFGAALAALRLL